MAAEAVLVGAAALIAFLAGTTPPAGAGYTVIAVLALAMGMRNAAVRRLGVRDLTTTVLTQTLTGLAADSRLAGGSDPRAGAADRRGGRPCWPGALAGGADASCTSTPRCRCWSPPS